MSLSILAMGTLVGDPKQRETTKGSSYATFLMRCAVKDAEPPLVSCVAFDEGAVRSVLALKHGDSCSITGSMRVNRWNKDGVERVGLGVVAERVMSAYESRKKSSAVEGKQACPAR
jgi:single-stranded DNA-binding protein